MVQAPVVHILLSNSRLKFLLQNGCVNMYRIQTDFSQVADLVYSEVSILNHWIDI